MSKPKVAFICVHNSCRSQIAEALCKHLASAIFESYSAGTETKPQINQDAVRLMSTIRIRLMENARIASSRYLRTLKKKLHRALTSSIRQI